MAAENDVTRAILKRLFERGTFTIPELVEDTGISMTTLAKYTAPLLDAGIIEARGKVKSGGRGREPVLYGVRKGEGYFLGIDVKSDELRLGLMDLKGDMVASTCVSDFRYENTPGGLERVCTEIERFLQEVPYPAKRNILQACLLIGGRVDPERGTCASNYNFEALDGSTLSEFLEDRLGMPVRIENDTKAMAYGEYLAILDKGYKNVLFINIGWGLGLGIIVDGKIYCGRNGYSGEFGHIHAYENNIICHCGKKGCLETEVSGRAAHRKLLERLSKGESSILAGKYRRGEAITMSDIIAAAQKEDPLCIDLISKVGSELGVHISSLLNIFNPECIIVGGQLSRAASYYFFYPLRAAIRKYSLKLLLQDVEVLQDSLSDEEGILSGCLIAREKYLSAKVGDLIQG